MGNYDMFREEVLNSLLIRYPLEEATDIIKYIDIVGIRYDIDKRCTSIISYDDKMEYYINMFVVNKFIEGRSKKTVNLYKIILKRFSRYVGKEVNVIDSNDIRYFLTNIKRDRNMSDSTLDHNRLVISNFFRWLSDEGHIKRNPCSNINKIRYNYIGRVPLTNMELEIFRDNCNTLKEKAVFETLYSTGCRVSELINIKISSIDFDRKSIVVFGKGKKYRTVFLNARSIVAINNYLRSLDYNPDYLFTRERAPHTKIKSIAVIDKMIKDISIRANIGREITSHVIRHTMATNAVANGMSIEEVSKILGHAKLSTTMIYVKVNLDDIRSKHEKCIL